MLARWRSLAPRHRATAATFLLYLVAESALFASGEAAIAGVVTIAFVAWMTGHGRGYADGLDQGFRFHMESVDTFLEHVEADVLENTGPDDPRRREIARSRALVQRAVRQGLTVGLQTDRKSEL